MAYIEENIDDLPASGTLTGAELLELLQGGVNKHLDIDALAAFIRKQAVAAASSTLGVLTLDCSVAQNFTVTLTENITSIVLTNLMGSGFTTEIEVEFKQNGTGGFTVALPANFKALGSSDTAVASAANAVTVLSAKTFDNGATWRYAMQESA